MVDTADMLGMEDMEDMEDTADMVDTTARMVMVATATITKMIYSTGHLSFVSLYLK